MNSIGFVLGLIFSFIFSFPAYLDGRRSITGFFFFQLIWTGYIFIIWLLCGLLYNAKKIDGKPRFKKWQRIFLFYGLGECIYFIAYGLICLWLLYVESPAIAADGTAFITVKSFVNLNVFLLVAHSLILFIYRYVSLESESNIIKLEKEKLEKENIRSQFEALRNQLNPHFLFNSLNSLRALVDSQPDKAKDFILQLSDVYRYLLKHRSHEYVPLREEIAFMESYAYLMKIRYEDTINIQISETYQDSFQIVPLTLQLLVENAVKHNIISTALPLSITIAVDEEDYIVVTNNFQPRLEVEGSSNFGLYNLNQQYKFLADEEIVIEKNDKHFIVKVPLLAKDKLKITAQL